MTYSEAVRYMMDQCDKHGLHHEVLSDFINDVNRLQEQNEERCRNDQPQLKPDYRRMAYDALYDWDI